MLTPIENILISFVTTPVQSLGAVQAGPLIGAGFVESQGQNPEALTEQFFKLTPAGEVAKVGALTKLQQIANPGIQAADPTVEQQPPFTVGETTKPGTGNTVQTEIELETTTPVGDDSEFQFPTLHVMAPKVEKPEPPEDPYGFDREDFAVGCGFVVRPEKDTKRASDDLFKEMKKVVAAANKRFKIDTGETETKTRKKSGKPESYEAKIYRQEKKFIIERFSKEEDGEGLGGVRIMRVEV